jgi:hypothetical protein
VPHLSRCTVPVVALAQPTPPCQRLLHFLGLVAPSSSACSAQGTGLVHSELAPVTDRGEPGLKLATHPATVSKNVHLQGAAERNTSVGQRVAYVRRACLAHRQKNKIKFRLRSMRCVRSTCRDTVAFLPTFAWSRSTRTHRPVNVAYLSCPDPPVSLLPDGEGRSRSPRGRCFRAASCSPSPSHQPTAAVSNHTAPRRSLCHPSITWGPCLLPWDARG